LRVNDFRVFYNVYGNVQKVEIKAIMRKVGSRLLARGKEIVL